jgi:hypothetical protein
VLGPAKWMAELYVTGMGSEYHGWNMYELRWIYDCVIYVKQGRGKSKSSWQTVYGKLFYHITNAYGKRFCALKYLRANTGII